MLIARHLLLLAFGLIMLFGISLLQPSSGIDKYEPQTKSSKGKEEPPKSTNATTAIAPQNPPSGTGTNPNSSDGDSWARIAMGGFWEWFKKWVNDPNAVFAAAVAAFTYFLVRVSKRQAKLTKDALVSGQRAFVYLKTITQYWNADTTPGTPIGIAKAASWTFRTAWANSGDTPTKSLRTHIRFDLRDAPLPDHFDFKYPTNEVGTALIAPRSEIQGLRSTVTVDELNAVRDGKRFFYISGWACYYDVFPQTPVRWTRFCYQVIVLGDPSMPEAPNPIFGKPKLPGVEFQFRLHPRNNCADEECE